MGWADEEFRGIDLGDKRRGDRAVLLLERLAERPTASIPGACNGWAETQGAYRFFAGEEYEWMDILDPHRQCTQTRMTEHPVVLCLQDTTELDFNGQGIAGLGPLSYEAQRGMYLHPTYAVSPAREPLGVLDAWMWAREPKGPDGTRPGIRESVRWSEGYARVAELAAEMPQTRLVYVADRESDLRELMVRARDLGTPADWLLRSKHNRALPEGGRLWEKVLANRPLGEIRFALPGGRGRTAREVRQELYAQRVSLSDGRGAAFDATCLIAREIGAPPGVKPIEWRLLTNRTAETLEAVVELIDWYRARWEIELPVLGPQGRLPHRGAATEHDGTNRTRLGAVPGGRLADCPPDALGADPSRSGCGPAAGARGVAGGLHLGQEAPAQEGSAPQRGVAPDRPPRGLSRAQRRRRARREDHLARPPARHGLRGRDQIRQGGPPAPLAPTLQRSLAPTPERLGKYSAEALVVAWMERSGIQVPATSH